MTVSDRNGEASARRPIHLHHVVLSLEPGGLENGVVNLVNRLDRTEFVSTIWCLKERGAFAQRVDPAAAVIHELNWRGGNDLSVVHKLARGLRSSGAELVHTRNAEAFFYGWAALQFTRRPALVHSEHGRTFNDRPIRFTAQRWMTRRADAVVALSDRLRLDLERYVGIPRDKVQVIYNGVDFERFAHGSRAAARRSLGLGDALVVGSVGRLVSVKNYDLLLRAVAGLMDIRAELVLVGDGPERPALERRASELGLSGRVHFTGHRDDVAGLMAAFDIFVLPSISEGMSNTLLEAMAAGLPVIASAVGGNTEIVRAGLEGMIFESGNERELTAALNDLAADRGLRESLGRQGRERAQRDFSMPAMVTAYEALYRGVMAQKGRPHERRSRSTLTGSD